MRFVFFYGSEHSFNYFSDCIADELHRRGHQSFFLDVTDYNRKGHSVEELNAFIAEGGGHIDAAICYNRLGIHTDELKSFFSESRIPVIDIYMDPAFRFNDTSAAPPAVYLRFHCDREHVAYVRRFFPDTVPFVEFLPHYGTVDEETVPYEERPYDVLFSGTFYAPQIFLDEIDRDYPVTSSIGKIIYMVLDYLLAHPSVSATQAFYEVVKEYRLGLNDRAIMTVSSTFTPLDWYIRMLYRMMVVQTVAGAGLELYLLGRGWENLPCTSFPNVHRIDDRIPFAESLRVIKQAKINLNVMPWFKDGTHDRIFNTLLRDSMPLTDDSKYLREHFADGTDLRYYSLTELDRLPEIASDILSHPEEAKRMIANGKKKVLERYTWKNCVDTLLDALERQRISVG